MKKIFCLMAMLFITASMFGATVWLPRIHPLQSGCDNWNKYENVSYTIANGVIHFKYNGKHYYSTIFIIEE